MQAEGIVIRQGQVRDIDALVGLLRILFELEEDFEFDAEKQRKGLEQILKESPDDKRCLMVADDGTGVVGMCSAQTLVSTAEGGPAAVIEDMVIGYEYRGAGIGKALLKAVEDWSIGNGITRLQLLADKNNMPALGFYGKTGWQTTQLICLRKRISPEGKG